MRITPLDIRKQEFKKAMRGLDPEEVYAFLNTIADEYEALLNDNKALRERVLELDDKVQEYRNMEKTLRDTLLTAERVNLEAKENARREAGIILKEAQIEAEKMLRNIKNEEAALLNSIRDLQRQKENYLARLKMLAEAHLKFIESAEKDFEEEDRAVGKRTPPRSEPEPSVRPAVEPAAESEGSGEEGEVLFPEIQPSTPARETPAAAEPAAPSQAPPPGTEEAEKSPASPETRRSTGDARLEEPQEKSREKPREKPQDRPEKTGKGTDLPDLNEILDRMAATQKEMTSPGAASEEGAPAPDRTDSVPSADPREEAAPAEEEWSLERLKRDILSGASGEDEKAR